MYCSKCSVERNESKVSKPDKTVVRFKCEGCGKLIIVAYKNDGTSVSKQRLTE